MKQKYIRGGVLFTDLPNLSPYKEYFPDGFEDWLARELGYYRLQVESRTTEGKQTKSDNINALKNLIASLEVIESIPDFLPDIADAQLSNALYENHGPAGLCELTERSKLKHHAMNMKAACNKALQEVSLMESKTGRDKNINADWLFVMVANSLTCHTLEDRLLNAVAILTLCRVKTPETSDSASLLRTYHRKVNELTELRLLMTKQGKIST